MFLPVGLSQQVDTVYELRDGRPPTDDRGQPSVVSGRLLKLLSERSSLRGRQIDSHFAKVDWRKTASFLVRKGVLSSKSILPPPRVRTKYIRVAQLSEAVLPEYLEKLSQQLLQQWLVPERQVCLCRLLGGFRQCDSTLSTREEWARVQIRLVPERLQRARHVHQRHVRLRAPLERRRLRLPALPQQLLGRGRLPQGCADGQRGVLLPDGLHGRRLRHAGLRREVVAPRQRGRPAAARRHAAAAGGRGAGAGLPATGRGRRRGRGGEPKRKRKRKRRRCGAACGERQARGGVCGRRLEVRAVTCT